MGSVGSVGSLDTVGSIGRAGIEVVLFDLGGVLVEVDGVSAMRELTGVDSDEELWRRWLGSQWVRLFERGHCSPEDFAIGIVKDWRLDIEPDAFLEAFAAWPGSLYDGADQLVQEVGEQAVVGCLSNTNRLHWDRHFSRWPTIQRLVHTFLSFDLGLVKPDVETFHFVAQALALDPARILFLDDNQPNVDAAATAGFTAVRARGLAEARTALAAAGLAAA